jgi:Fanconi anemia group M protein
MQQSAALTIFHMLEILQTQGAFTLKSFMERMENDDKKSHKMLVRSEAYRELQQLLYGNCYVEHPKAEALVQIIKNQIKSNPNSRMLVFTQYRDSATHIVDMLNQVDTIKVERFVGQMSKMGDRGLTQEEQIWYCSMNQYPQRYDIFKERGGLEERWREK